MIERPTAVRLERIKTGWAVDCEVDGCAEHASFYVIPPDFDVRGPDSIKLACKVHAEGLAITMVTGADR